MAKAKKSESSAPKKSAKEPKSTPSKSRSRSSSGTATDGFVDTNLAAQAAARMLLAKKSDQGDSKKSSGGLIDQLKADLNKHPSTSVAGVLDKTAPPGTKKSHLPFGGKQVAHNQTFSGDVTRSGVPRRTPG